MIEYYFADPTGNKTILVTTKVPIERQPQVAAELLKLETEAEQVGYVSSPEQSENADIVLRMAGGEFCGNATLSAAALFCMTDGMRPGEKRCVTVNASGTSRPNRVMIECEAETVFSGMIEMPSPIEISELALAIDGGEVSLPAVVFDGITHVICKKENRRITPDDAERLIAGWCRAAGCTGLGMMFYDENAGRLDPLVYVREPETMYWEHSCASGTTAVGVYEALLAGREVHLALEEPGGVLEVTAAPGGVPKLKGHVSFANNFRIKKLRDL